MSTSWLCRQLSQYALKLLILGAVLQPAYALPTTAFDSALLKPRYTPQGTFIIPGKCTGNNLDAVQNALLDASYLAGAGIVAAQTFTELPFRYFFKGDLPTANTVAGVLDRVQQHFLGNGPLIGITCEDVYNNCVTGATNTFAYAAQTPGGTNPPLIVMCPIGLQLARNPPACSTTKPGSLSLGWLMLHELTHIHSISGTLNIGDTTGESARDVQDHLDDGGDTTLDANAYAYLGSWSWDEGLSPAIKVTSCLVNFKTGNFDLTGLQAVDLAVVASNPGWPAGILPPGGSQVRY